MDMDMDMDMMLSSYPVKSLYVGDLEEGVDETDLHRTFSPFPGLASFRLCRDRTSRRSLRYAYLNFHSPPQAERVLTAMNHMPLKGKPMRIMWVKRDPYSRKTGLGNLYVKNLELTVTASDLETVFSQFGSVLSCKVVYDESTQRSRQFGFVQLISDKAAHQAISALHRNPSTCLSKSLYVAKFVKKGGEKKNLYIKNLDGSITNEALSKQFSQFGRVESAVVMRDEHGNSKGFGFVSFEQSREAQSAISAMNGATWGLKVLYVAFAQKKAEREALLKSEFAEKSKEEEEIRRGGSNRGYGVYVANLDESVTAEELKQLFETCGDVVSAKVILDPSQRNRGYGFVHFSTPKQARCALSMDGTSILKTRPVIVKQAFSKQSRKKGVGAGAGTTKSTISATATGTGTASTLSPHADSVAPTQPYPYCQLYHSGPLMSTYNVQPIDENKWANYYSCSYSYCYPPPQPQPATAPFSSSYFDPKMQCIDELQPSMVASGWKMGRWTPVMHALSSSGNGKRAVRKGKGKGENKRCATWSGRPLKKQT